MKEAPGLKRRTRVSGTAWYWIAPEKDVREGFAPKSVTLDAKASDEDRAARCRELQADLLAWRTAKRTTGQNQAQLYSIPWLIHRYQTDPTSPYHNLKAKTRDGYDAMCKIIEKALDKQRIDPRREYGAYRPRITGHEVRKWHADCAAPGASGKPRPARARYMIVVLRILASYAVEIGVPGAEDFRRVLSTVRFKVGLARTSAPTRAQVVAIAKKALELDYRSIAITTLAQFELTERRISIIGEWEAGQWRPGWVWQGISADWVVTYTQNKVGRVERAFDLRETPALLELLQSVLEDQRVGPVVICERTGKPWRYRHYISAFRKVARAADIPDDVWSMDMRAGGATEAGHLGITAMDMQAAGGWADVKTAARYTRDRVARAQNVVRLRQAKAGTNLE